MERPILFNTEMVKALIALIKKNTRRPIKIEFLPGYNPEWTGYKPVHEYGKFFLANSRGEPATKEVKAPCAVGDTLWVRETWGNWSNEYPESNAVYYQYKADYPEGAKTYMFDDEHECDLPKWHPSIHMPRAAARIFLKVTDVRVERLQNINTVNAKKEGFKCYEDFIRLWDSLYHNVNDNPWVWVIEFERVCNDANK